MPFLRKFLRHYIAPILFCIAGIFFLSFVHGHSFLGLMCFGVAGVITSYRLLHLLSRRKLRLAKILRLILTIMLCIGLTAFAVTEFFIIRASFGQPDKSCDYILVLGAKVNGTSPSLSLADRIRSAADYLNRHPDTVAILSGGQGPDEGISEAQCMYNELTKLGIDPDRLWLEDKATSTRENLLFSLDLIEAKTGTRPASIGLLSSEYHLLRATLFAEDCGVEAIGIPAETSWLSLKLNYYSREAAGIWYYLIFGG